MAIRVHTRVVLREAAPGDEAAFLAMTAASRRVLAPWLRPPYTPGEYAKFMARADGVHHFSFLVIERGGGEIAGVISLSNIVRGSFCSAHLGYYGAAKFAGTGAMTAGLKAVIERAFGPLKLHRMEANIQPTNVRSIALVRKLGFRLEGFSPRYLRVNGRWRDHERWALLRENWKPMRRVRT
jgi:ribosomal-protein-alanine N-acetyltransferase